MSLQRGIISLVALFLLSSASGCILGRNLPCVGGCGDCGIIDDCSSCGGGSCGIAAPACGCDSCGPSCGCDTFSGGCASFCGDGCIDGCASYGSWNCGESCCPRGPAMGTPFQWLRYNLGCGGGCGDMYWGEWISDPPDCCDPCDNHGNWTGCQSCVRNDFFSGLRGIFGYRYCPSSCGGGCGDTCYGGGGCTSCGGPGGYHEGGYGSGCSGGSCGGTTIQHHSAPEAVPEPQVAPPEPKEIETNAGRVTKRPYYVKKTSTRMR